jgi:hypothetical protein
MTPSRPGHGENAFIFDRELDLQPLLGCVWVDAAAPVRKKTRPIGRDADAMAEAGTIDLPAHDRFGHERPIRFGDRHVRSYLNFGCAKMRGCHSGFGPTRDMGAPFQVSA